MKIVPILPILVFQSRSLCSSPLPEPSPSLTSSSSSSPSEWGPQARDTDWAGQNRAPSPARPGQASPLPYQHQDHQPRQCKPQHIHKVTLTGWMLESSSKISVEVSMQQQERQICLKGLLGKYTYSLS